MATITLAARPTGTFLAMRRALAAAGTPLPLAEVRALAEALHTAAGNVAEVEDFGGRFTARRAGTRTWEVQVGA